MLGAASAAIHGGRRGIQSARPHGTAIAAAATGQWRDWWRVCVGGQVVFLPTIFLLSGRWSPKKARQQAAEHERLVERELAALRGQ